MTDQERDEAITEAAHHYAIFQVLVTEHGITGEEIAERLKQINVNEQVLESGGARI